MADTHSHRIQKFTLYGEFLTKWGTFGYEDGQFDRPCGISIEGASGELHVADIYGLRIQVFDLNGKFLDKWEGERDGQIGIPKGVVVDSSGNIYIADTKNNRIRKFAGMKTKVRNLLLTFAIWTGVNLTSDQDEHYLKYRYLVLRN